MKRAFSLAAALLLFACATPTLSRAQSVPQTTNFQGRLAKPDGTPVGDVASQAVTFRLYSASTGGTLLWSQSGSVAVRNGTFAARLDFSTGFATGQTLTSVFSGSLVYLEVQVGNEAPLIPRQPLTSNAYAFTANLALSVPDGSITGVKIASGTITADKFASGIFNPLAWLLGGNSGVTSGFLGTTDNQPLVLKVNGQQAMRYSYAEDTSDPNRSYRSINVLGGSEVNSIAAGVLGATIAGGGLDFFTGTDYPNQVTAYFGTIGGGYSNTASGETATVAGGGSNKANGNVATVAGGRSNTASGTYATIAGGYFNIASGDSAAIAGGRANTAGGQYSFAAGQQAEANHNGSFVWNDSTDAVFPSTDVNQFLIHATGGVGINTNTPNGYALTVNGSVHVDGSGNGLVFPDGTTQTTAASFSGVTAGGDLSGSYPNPILAANSVTTAKIADGAVTGAKIADTAITTAKLADAAITTAKLANGAVTGAKLASGVLPTSLPPSGSAGGDLSGSYPNPILAANSVTTAKIADAAITTAKLADGAVPNTKLASDAASLVKVSGGAMTSSNGSIGIGTTTPTAILHVKSPANANATLAVDSGTTSSQYSAIDLRDQGTPVWGVGKNPASNFYIDRSGVGNVLTITAASLNVGLGTTTPAYKLDVNGQVRASNVSVTSDARYKTHVATFPNALDTILGLRGVTFDWNRDLWQEKNFASGRQVGFIAQEVESVLPELVTTDASGYKSVAYQNVVPVLVEAVKTLKKDNDAKQQRIETLQADSDAKAAELATIKARLDAIEKLLLRRKP